MSCELKRRHKTHDYTGENNPNWKGCKIKCTGCNEKIIWYKSKTRKCKKCYHDLRKQLITGKNNPNWRGGISKSGYSFDFNKELKKEIFKRDKYVCQLCFIYPTSDLTVHHIDYNKMNSSKLNLITLCRSCNSRVNFRRDCWKIFFQEKIKQKYNKS